jgi:hypothetical protein
MSLLNDLLEPQTPPGKSFDPFALPKNKVSIEQAQAAYTTFEKLVDGDWKEQLVTPPDLPVQGILPPRPESYWLKQTREEIVEELGFISDPDFVAKVRFLLVTIDPTVEIALQETPMLNKLLGWGEIAEWLGRVGSTAERYRKSLEWEYSKWKAHTEPECLEAAMELQVKILKGNSEKEPASSSRKPPSGKEADNARIRKYEIQCDYFEIRLIYMQSVVDTLKYTREIVQAMEGSNATASRILAYVR